LVIFQAPVILGAGALPAFGSAPAPAGPDLPRLRVVERRVLDDDVMTLYALTELPA
jgi:diaminohydroxyphosphoribosylaminopyrimidine deaminase/5-amino-6-(5-phosphoribosylamino)uracil reductase